MSRQQFEKYYADNQLPCLSSVKERHWQTWMEAQATLLAAHGPVVFMELSENSKKAALEMVNEQSNADPS